MSGWAPRRFWTAAEAVPAGDGWEVRLDGRPVRTPGKLPQLLPSRALAAAVAAEWAAQGERIDPGSMPFTRMANSAIERVAPDPAPVAAHLAAYAETDLLCYRAETPAALVRRQEAAWGPWLDWAERRHGARLIPVAGVVPRPQPPAALAALRAATTALDAFELTALHDLVALPGSLVLGLAALEPAAPPEALWAASRVDEDWQAEDWGRDEEAEAAAAGKRRAFARAARFAALARGGDPD